MAGQKIPCGTSNLRRVIASASAFRSIWMPERANLGLFGRDLADRTGYSGRHAAVFHRQAFEMSPD
nr:16S rRNA (cytosine(1402)-N(4))-methyltransferase [Afipia sp.]